MSFFERIFKSNKKDTPQTLKGRIFEEIEKHVESRERLLAYLGGDIVALEDAELQSLMFVENCSGEHLLRGKMKRIFGETQEWHNYANKHKVYHDTVRAIIEQYQAGNIKKSRKLQKDYLTPAVEGIIDGVSRLLELVELTDHDGDEMMIDHETEGGAATKITYSRLQLTDVFGSIILEHSKKRDVLKRLTKGEAIKDEELDILVNHESWPLTKWLKDEGHERYAGAEELAKFEQSFQTYHTLIDEIIQKYNEKDLEALKIFADRRLSKVINAFKHDAMALFFYIKNLD